MEDILQKYIRLGVERRRALGRRAIVARFDAIAPALDYQQPERQLAELAQRAAASAAPSVPDHGSGVEARMQEFTARQLMREQLAQRICDRGPNGFRISLHSEARRKRERPGIPFARSWASGPPSNSPRPS